MKLLPGRHRVGGIKVYALHRDCGGAARVSEPLVSVSWLQFKRFCDGALRIN